MDAGGVDVLGQLVVEPFEVEFEALGVAVELLVAEAPLVLVEEVVHGPELPLGRRGLGGLRRRFASGCEVLIGKLRNTNRSC